MERRGEAFLVDGEALMVDVADCSAVVRGAHDSLLLYPRLYLKMVRWIAESAGGWEESHSTMASIAKGVVFVSLIVVSTVFGLHVLFIPSIITLFISTSLHTLYVSAVLSFWARLVSVRVHEFLICHNYSTPYCRGFLVS